MNILLASLVVITSLFSAIGQYIDKHLVNLGISRKDYFYYMCLSMIPFSLIMIFIEYNTNKLRFCFNIVPIILLLLAMFLRYKKQNTVVGCLKYLNAYEESAYLTLGIVIAFIIDVILGIKKISYIAILSIILTILGVFFITNSKLKIKNLQKDLITKIITSLLISYVTHYILKYWSNAVFILFLNLLLTLIFSKDYTLDYYKKQNKIIKWVFIQQIFGFSTVYLTNFLTSNSVTLSSYVKPMSIAIVLIIALFFKDKNKKPNLRQILAIVLVISGIVLINFN